MKQQGLIEKDVKALIKHTLTMKVPTYTIEEIREYMEYMFNKPDRSTYAR